MTKLDVLLVISAILALYALWWVLGQIDALEVIVEPYMRWELNK